MNSKGIALVTGLLILAAVSLVAITAAGSMTMQRKQAANFHDKALALANAELAESWARAWLFSRADIERQASCTYHCILPPAVHPAGALADSPELRSLQWWSETATHSGANPAMAVQLPGSDTNSFWLMEEIHFTERPEADGTSSPAGIGFYRIVSFGAGRNPRSAAVIESIVARPWQAAYTPLSFPPVTSLGSYCRQFSPDIACGTMAWRQLR